MGQRGVAHLCPPGAERIEQDLGGLSRALRAQGFEEARITVDVAEGGPARCAASLRVQDALTGDPVVAHFGWGPSDLLGFCGHSEHIRALVDGY